MRLLDFSGIARQQATTVGLIGDATVEGAFGPAALEGHGFITTHFSAGARTLRHQHPLGQVLIVSQGCGYLQIDGFPIQRLQQGDMVRIPPKCVHWHGADEESTMVQITITDALYGIAVEWLDQDRPLEVVQPDQPKRALTGNTLPKAA